MEGYIGDILHIITKVERLWHNDHFFTIFALSNAAREREGAPRTNLSSELGEITVFRASEKISSSLHLLFSLLTMILYKTTIELIIIILSYMSDLEINAVKVDLL